MNIIKIFKINIILILIFSQNLLAENSIYELTSKRIKYSNNNKLIIAEGDAYAKDQFGKEIFSDKIIYDKSKLTITTNNNSIYKDLNGNILTAKNFFYDLSTKKISAVTNVKFIDKNKNIFYFSNFEYFENSEIGYGQNMRGELSDKSSVESPYIEINNKLGTLISKTKENEKMKKISNFFSFFDRGENIYTTCENTNILKEKIKDRCPDWSITSSKTTHDSNKKMVFHNNAIIKLRNIPVFYTPYFSHPDPTVDRKSGFLPPSTKNFTDLGRTFRTPYFLVLDENKDITFTPIFYLKENSILLTEYRQQNLNSSMYIDSSYSKGYKNLNKYDENGVKINRTSGSRNHLFLKFLGNYDNLLLDNNEIEANIQRISQKNYLKVNQINTNNLKQDISRLENSLKINSYKNNKNLKIESKIYENLSDDNPNTKYEYQIPYLELANFFEKFDQTFITKNSINFKNYNGDSKKFDLINQIDTFSDQKVIRKLGLGNILRTNISNVNYYNENIENTKENLNSDIFITTGLETFFPLGKFKDKQEETIIPKILIKKTIGPKNNLSNNNKILSYGDVYSMNRTGDVEKQETGTSMGYGVEYNLNKKNDKNQIYLNNNFYIGQIFKRKNANELPITSSLNQKKSNIVGTYEFFYSKAMKEYNNQDIKKKTSDEIRKDGLNLKYNFNLKNDLSKILKNEITVEYNNENNSLKTSYSEVHDIGNSQYISLDYIRSFNNNLNLLFGGTKNLETDFSEQNYIEVNYESDCLKLGLNLSKNFFKNQDLNTSSNLTLFLMIKPFGQPFSPDLTNLLNNDFYK